MGAPKAVARQLGAPPLEEDALFRSLENAPLDSEAFAPEEVAEVEAALADPRGAGKSTAELLAELAKRTTSEG
jgi:hypothetical protein